LPECGGRGNPNYLILFSEYGRNPKPSSATARIQVETKNYHIITDMRGKIQTLSCHD
jgi:hypothetical protein